MRIVIYNPSYPPVRCGIGEYNRGLAQALSDAGHDVTVVTATAAQGRPRGRPRVLALMRDWGVRDFLRTVPRVAWPRPDVVVTGFPAVMPGRYVRMLYLLPVFAKLTLGLPRTVYVVHEFVRAADRERNALGLALRCADRIVAVTEHERAAIVARYPAVAGRVVVAPNPPTIPRVAEDPAGAARLREKLAGRGRPLLMFFGLLASPDKGFDDALDALALTGDGAVLAVTGDLDPARVPYHRELLARIERHGLTERVRWLGHVADDVAARLLRAADAVLLPYRLGADGSYTSLLAAIANGAAVVTTRGAQNPAWLRDGETALVVAPSDPRALADAVATLRAEPATAARIRAGAAAVDLGWDAISAAITGAPARRIAWPRSSGGLLKRQER